VRSGAKFSMPGMMDTILNLGLNPETLGALARATGNERFALDAYRRFIQIFGNVVLGIKHDAFEGELSAIKTAAEVTDDQELAPEHLTKLIERYQSVVRKEAHAEIPEDPMEQLRMAITAVFESWNNPRAVTYRNTYKIPHDLGTAVSVQAMVFGNMGDDSGTGVAFSRNPSTGENRIYGEFLLNAQGEDVVAGIRTPLKIDEMKQRMPAVADELFGYMRTLDSHFKDMQDVEFTVERGVLYVLQTRTGKRTGQAAVRIAVELAREGVIDKVTALLRVEPLALNQLLHKQIDRSTNPKKIAEGLNASPGAAVGKIAFTADEAVERAKEGETVVLVRAETNPDDIHGLISATGVLTARGGMTSHAAVVARGMGKPCVAGCSALAIDEEAKTLTVMGRMYWSSDTITIDGTTGDIFEGACGLIEPTVGDDLREFLSWADEYRRLKVRANADTPTDARTAYDFGAEGIGLCRTEHMFFKPERIPVVQAMILSANRSEREEHLRKLLEMQRDDFVGIFREMRGNPVTIRLLDPPLHEFLPKDDEQIDRVVDEFITTKGGVKSEQMKKALKAKIRATQEANPMLGLRGCRLGIVYPEINEMQVEAIISAALIVEREGMKVKPEIMIPLVGTVNELKHIKPLLLEVAERTMKASGKRIEYMFGTMIEVPRAALTAGEIAREAEFFSFGTNDLTQMTLGISRDDAEQKFLHLYVEQKIYAANPFEEIDRAGVGRLIKLAVQEGRASRPNLKIGICGEHGGDPESVKFCHETGLDYVSCSPFRVPIARLAAAQAALADTHTGTVSTST
jgi:pyruvate,orthophosphate dikinase